VLLRELIHPSQEGVVGGLLSGERGCLEER
jgi:hypothetical protein